jgi:MFS family permease
MSSIRLLAAAVAVTTAGTLPAFLTGGLAVQLRADLGFDEGGLGIAVGSYFGAAAATSIALGRLSERLGPTASLRLAVLGSASVLAAIATLANSWFTLCVLLALGGVWNALAQPAANLLLTRAIDPRRLGLAFAMKQAAIPLSSLIAGAAVPTVALELGWRWAYAICAVLALLAVPLPPRQHCTAVQPRNGTQAYSPVAGMYVLTFGLMFASASANAFGAFLVSAGVAAGLSVVHAGLTLTGGSLIGVCARVYAGYLADRREGKNLRVVSLMLVGTMLSLLVLALHHPLLTVLITPIAFGIGWGWPPLSNLAVVRAQPEAPAAATGVSQMGVSIGAIVGPTLFGQLVLSGSYRTAWLVMAAMALGAAVLVRASRRTMMTRLGLDP